jgi:hypothetical protein
MLFPTGVYVIPAEPCENANDQHSGCDPRDAQDFPEQLIFVKQKENCNDDDCPC